MFAPCRARCLQQQHATKTAAVTRQWVRSTARSSNCPRTLTKKPRLSHRVAKKVLFDYHPQEPDVWLQLAAQHFPVFRMAGTLYSTIAPYYGTEKKPDFIIRHEESGWEGDDMCLLEFLRKMSDNGRPMKFIVDALQAQAQIEPEGCHRQESVGSFRTSVKDEG